MSTDTLAVIELSDNTRLSLLRLPDGLLALGSANSITTIGTTRDMQAVIEGLQAVVKTIGPEGGT